MSSSHNTIKLPVTTTQRPLVKTEMPVGIALEDTAILLFEIDDLHVTLRNREEVVLGRVHPSNKKQPDIDLTDFGAALYGISRLHIKLARKNDSWWLEDLESSNGTWVNGERLAPFVQYELFVHSRIRLANLEFGFILPEAEKQPSTTLIAHDVKVERT
ncbi:MAG: FHA domain-containing protein [Chloroflexota bacterium]